MAVCCAALMCHAPIVIPTIGDDRAAECARTTHAMGELADRVIAHRPDLLVVVSPHAPRQGGLFGVVDAQRIAGSFARFGFPRLATHLPGAPDEARSVRTAAARLGVQCWTPPGDDLDHGALVPLHFLVEAGWSGPTLILSLPSQENDSVEVMGEALRNTADEHRQRWAVVASGDMSHRLQPGAPGGFDPRAREFDAGFVAHVRSGDYRAACEPDPFLQDLAAEDVVASTLVAAAAAGFRSDGHVLLSYEGPFGVGYCESLLYSDGAPASRTDDAYVAKHAGSAQSDAPPAILPEIAREAIRADRLRQPLVLPPLKAPWHDARAVFVTLRDPSGELRGCIGRTEPSFATLAEEIADCAVSAATRDPRFERVQLGEIDRLRIEVSVLCPPEPVASRADLDPERYGVVVTLGFRRGVLLPDLEGVDSVAAQLHIAAEKAGLRDDEPYTIERFEVRKVASEQT
jgi:AmmeMemoRadiSam system protein A